jgi:UDP:flavonoid glycosyltransferase YjiC (YdhE family)
MARVLAVTWDGGGNVPPMLGIVERLRKRGHDVRVLGHEQQRAAVEKSGAEFVAYRHARPWLATETHTPERTFAMFTETGPGEDVAAELGAPLAPDLVLADGLRLAALRAAQRLRVPTVALVHSFHRYFTHGWARGPIGLLATARGLRPTTLWNACDRVLVATDRALDPADDLPANVIYTGPVLSTPAPGDRPETPLVLVSLSTIFYPAQAAVLQNVLDGLADLDVRVVVAVGDSVDPAALSHRPDVEVRRFVDHDDVMSTAALLVGHGGHATTLRALSHGLPVLVVPLHPMLDQKMIGRAVAATGAARVLPTKAGPQAIRAAVRALLADDAARAAAAACGARIRSQDGAAEAVMEIEAVLAARR